MASGRSTARARSRWRRCRRRRLRCSPGGSPARSWTSIRLFTETEGNPLFVVETLRAGEPAPRVQAVLEARLAQLSDPARRLAVVAAAVGREFTADVLAEASGVGEDELVRGLDGAVAAPDRPRPRPGGVRLHARPGSPRSSSPPGLEVHGAAREPSRLEDLADDGLGDRPIAVPANGQQRADRLEGVHRCDRFSRTRADRDALRTKRRARLP